MKRLTNVSFEAEGGGRFHIFRNGEKLVGYSNREYKVIQEIMKLQLAEPDASFHYEQVLKVVCTPEFEEVAPPNNGEHVLVYSAHESEVGSFEVSE